MINYILILVIKLFYPSYWFMPASLIYAQAWHETGGFKSNIYKQNKNLFGMKASRVRTHHLGTKFGHAYYSSNVKSILDYFDRQKQFNISYKNVYQYILDTVKSGYAEDTKYLTRWQTIYESKKYLSIVVLAVIPALIGLIVLIRK